MEYFLALARSVFFFESPLILLSSYLFLFSGFAKVSSSAVASVGRLSIFELDKNEEVVNWDREVEYSIVDDYGIPKEELHDDFRDLLGDILVDIMDDQLEEDNFEYVSDD